MLFNVRLHEIRMQQNTDAVIYILTVVTCNNNSNSSVAYNILLKKKLIDHVQQCTALQTILFFSNVIKIDFCD